MNESLSKLFALRARLKVLNETNFLSKEIVDDLRNQFLKEAEILQKQYPILDGFNAVNYSGEGGAVVYGKYMHWVAANIIGEINYFIDFLSKREEIQIPNLTITDEGLFFAGQHFDALLKFNNMISSAEKEIILIDNYIDEKILHLLASKNKKVLCRVLTLEKPSKTLETFIDAFRKDYENLELRFSNKFHDRFVIIDQSKFYHFGASIKDAGKKGFMFSKIEQDFIQKALLAEFETIWSNS